MSRDTRLYLEDMLVSARKVQRYAAAVELSEFRFHDEKYDAIVRNLELIGEAAKHVAPDVRDLYPEVEWRSMAGLRDVLIHVYFALDDETLWNLVQEKVPVLIAKLEQVLINDSR